MAVRVASLEALVALPHLVVRNQRIDVLLSQRLSIGQLQANPGQGHALQVQHIVATAQGAEPFSGFAARYGRCCLRSS